MFSPTYNGYYKFSRGMLIRSDTTRDGDALWRTGLGYICYKAPELKAGIDSCFPEIEGKVHPLRFPYTKEEPYLYEWARTSVSRDQVAMAVVALRWHGGDSKKIPWKFSKYTLSPDLYLWLRKKYKLWELLLIIQLQFLIPWNKFWRQFYTNTGIIGRIMYPHYSLFNTAFMLAVVPDNKLVAMCRRLLLREVEEDNYVLQLMLGATPSINDMLSYEPKSFRWNLRTDEPSDVYTPDDRELEFNNLDQDLLWAAIKWNKKNITQGIDILN